MRFTYPMNVKCSEASKCIPDIANKNTIANEDNRLYVIHNFFFPFPHRT